jgi:hypothetical protein
MSFYALAILSLLMGAIFLRGVWILVRLYRLRANGISVTGRVVECQNGSENCTATIQYSAGGGVWHIHDSAELGEYRVGQEVAIQCFPNAPANGEVWCFRAWYDAWAGVVLPVLGELFFVFWPSIVGA